MDCKECAPGLIPITDEEFKEIQALVYDHLGINLTERKRSLVIGRLHSMLRQLHMSSFREYCDYLQSDKSGRAISDLADRISTNHTYFNRESGHFEYFQRKVLPEVTAALKEQRSDDLRIWCAGCSSGEESYTLVMYMMDYFGSDYSRWNAGILATDLSERMLARARAAVYERENVKKLPSLWISKYFTITEQGKAAVADKVKKEVLFRRFNFMNARFPFKKRFHAIFCRNVMIYFDPPTRRELVNRFYDATEPGGYLFIGHSESLDRGNSLYEYIVPAVYRKPGIL